MALDEAARGQGAVAVGDRHVPDPTNATVQMLLREVGALKELTSQRMDGIEKAIKVAHSDLVRVPTDTQNAVGALKELIHAEHLTILERFRVQDERFASIQQQFLERDVRTEQTQRDSKVAVDAALQAAKEAVGKQQDASDRAVTKSEVSFTKQIDQQNAVNVATKSELDSRINDVKERLAGLVSLMAGRTEQVKETRENLGGWIAAAGFLVGLAGVVIAFVARGG